MNLQAYASFSSQVWRDNGKIVEVSIKVEGGVATVNHTTHVLSDDEWQQVREYVAYHCQRSNTLYTHCAF